MNNVQATRSVVVNAKHGLHMRPASAIAKTVRRFDAAVWIVKGDLRVDTRSPLEIVLLAADKGTPVILEATGVDAEAALDALVEVFARPFDDNELDYQI